MFNKPVVGIYDNELVKSKYGHLKIIKKFCKRTNASLVNINNEEIKDKDLVISEKFYKNYIDNYIKCHNQAKKRIDIIKEHINFYE